MNDSNILCGPDGHVNAVLDLFESQGGPFVWDLAVALGHLAIALPDFENDLEDCLREAANAYSECMPNVLSEFGDIELFMVRRVVDKKHRRRIGDDIQLVQNNCSRLKPEAS